MFKENVRLAIVRANRIPVALIACAGRIGRTHVQNAVNVVCLHIFPMNAARIHSALFIKGHFDGHIDLNGLLGLEHLNPSQNKGYAGFLWRCIQAHTTQTGWEPDKVPALWRKVEIIHENTKRIWQAGVDYALGDSVFYPDENGTEYVCITAHTSQTGWEPPNVSALWQKKTSTEAPQIALN